MWDSRDGYPEVQALPAYPTDAIFYVHLLILCDSILAIGSTQN